jgi:hypothetical protein
MPLNSIYPIFEIEIVLDSLHLKWVLDRGVHVVSLMIIIDGLLKNGLA